MYNLQDAISKGVHFFSRDQQTDGSFLCQVSTKMDDYKHAKTVPAIVPTNIVLSSLIHIPENRSIKEIKKKSADFLLEEKSGYWSYNYWFRKSDWYKKEPYPDDLDDTFCALAALYEYRPKLFNGKAMAKIVTMLTSAEEKEGGPYDMWLVPPEARKTWKDTDLVVNSNIAFFLALQDIRLPGLDGFIDESIEKKDYIFPYITIYPGIYFISRFYKGPRAEEMVRLVLSKQESDGKWENPLRTALAVSSLINLSGGRFLPQLEKGIEYLIRTQGQGGSWRPYSFYFQMKTKEKTLYAGSDTTTTALCLEAINKFKTCLPKQAQSKILTGGQNPKVYQQIVDMVKTRFMTCDADLRQAAAKMLAKTLRADADRQIVLMPYYFKLSLGKSGKKVSEDLIIRLGAANVFGWLAYTIYDDFLDDEGDPLLVSVANVCLRESAELLASALPQETGFAHVSKEIFDIIDGANAWEVANCRIQNGKYPAPDYGDFSQLANKSLGHSLSPMAILFALGFREKSSEVRSILQFFKHYLIARQLNDDAHDWENDFKMGHINAAAAETLNAAKQTGYKLEKLQQIFWKRMIVKVVKAVFQNVRLAKIALSQLKILEQPDFFLSLLAEPQAAGEQALAERKLTQEFLNNYKKKEVKS